MSDKIVVPPGCSKNPALCPPLRNYPCMSKFKEKMADLMTRMKSEQVREEITNKVKQRMDEEYDRRSKEVTLKVKKKFLENLSEYQFTVTADTSVQTIEQYDIFIRPSDEFIVKAQKNDMIRLDIGNRGDDDADWDIPISYDDILSEVEIKQHRPSTSKELD